MENIKEEDEKINRKATKHVTVVLVIIIILLSLTLSAVVFKNEFLGVWYKIIGNTFSYNGVEYTKVKVGSLDMYGAKLSIYQSLKNQTVNYILYLRNDPRIIDKMQSNVTNRLQPNIYVSFEREPFACKESSLASYKLADFIKALGSDVKGAYANSDMINATEKNRIVRNCSDADERTGIILMKRSDKDYSYVHQDGFCYILEIHECEAVETSERLMLSLIDLMVAAASQK